MIYLGRVTRTATFTRLSSPTPPAPVQPQCDALYPRIRVLHPPCLTHDRGLKTVLLLADQLLCLAHIECVHSRNVIDGVIKPDHFLMGIGECGDQVSVVNFGLTNSSGTRWPSPMAGTQGYYQEAEAQMNHGEDGHPHRSPLPRFPQQFGTFLNYTRALRFDDQSDYSYPINKFT